MRVCFDVWIDGRWEPAADLTLSDPTAGIAGATQLAYRVPYASRYLGRRGHAALSVRFPVDFVSHTLPTWPAFALDMLPAGNARRNLVQRLGLTDGATADAALLAQAHYPPGNVRVSAPPSPTAHPGFSKEDILARREDFIEYAHSHGAAVAGSSGAQGDAPKFLLIQDKRGRWHSEGALPDADVAQHWLVKFPRGRTERDRLILRTEAVYARIAEALGLRTSELPSWERDALFVPRFDRANGERFGMESLCSLAGIAQFGARVAQETLLQALRASSSTPDEDALEFICRDMLNIALANNDNHARNSAVLKRSDGSVSLSPLYDVAPMALDPEGIPRSCRWTDCEENARPVWRRVSERFAAQLWPQIEVFGRRLRGLPAMLEHFGVEAEVREFLRLRIAALVEQFP